MIGIEGRAWRPLAALAQALAIAMAAALACASPEVATAAPNTPHGRYANMNGIRMYYVVRGEGPVLVLLHGGGGSGEQFGRQVPAFEKHFLIALMNLLGVKRFDVMGWSDGGDTGLDLAIHHPDRLRRLVTFGANFSPSGLNPADVAWNDTATFAAFGAGMREGWTRLSPQPDHYEAAMTKILVMWRTLPRFTAAELKSI
ncbi:MAG: hypothetical protein E6K72_05110, partial [Candidatus Eisenbacteria bacterium]